MGSIGENLAFGAKYKPKRDVGEYVRSWYSERKYFDWQKMDCVRKSGSWLFFHPPTSPELQYRCVTSGFTRLSMETKYVCRGLISLYVSFHNNRTMWSTKPGSFILLRKTLHPLFPPGLR